VELVTLTLTLTLTLGKLALCKADAAPVQAELDRLLTLRA